MNSGLHAIHLVTDASGRRLLVGAADRRREGAAFGR